MPTTRPSLAWARYVTLVFAPGQETQSCKIYPQVPMSKMEPDEALNDRYKAIEDRLSVRGAHVKFAALAL